MKPNANGSYVYKTRELPTSPWITLETLQPLNLDDTVEHSGAAWKVCFLIEDSVAAYVVLKRIRAVAPAKPRSREARAQLYVVKPEAPSAEPRT